MMYLDVLKETKTLLIPQSDQCSIFVLLLNSEVSYKIILDLKQHPTV